jgi:hypothetical protein
MPPKKKMNSEAIDDRRVLVDREEYAALLSLKEADELRVINEDKTNERIHDLRVTCDAQASRLAEVALTIQHLEKVTALQRILNDMLRADHPAVASLEELSAFWRAWFPATEGLMQRDPRQRDEIAKVEPDLFRSWKIWVRDAGRVSRSFAVAGSRAEVEARLPASQTALQERILEQHRAHNALLLARIRELEGELDEQRKHVLGLTGPQPG